ncbi:MAG: apolipoprotein N-acyltransferase, partial [Acidobacteriota bacterium]
VAAVLGGGLFAFGFGVEVWPLAGAIGIAPLVWAVATSRSRGESFRLGFVWGVVFWFTSLVWLVPTVVNHGGQPTLVSIALVALFASYLALYPAFFSFVGRSMIRGPLWLALLALPSWWLALSWVRGWFFGGFPWNLAAYAWVDIPGALPVAAWIGAWGVTWLVVFTNVGLARAVLDRRVSPALLAMLIPLLIFGFAGRPATDVAPTGEPVRIDLVQPNIPIRGADADPGPDYRRLIEQSRRICDGTPRVLVWPESAAYPLTWQGDLQLQKDLIALAAEGCAVVLNNPFWVFDEDAPTDDNVEMYNTALLVDERGLVGRYAKRRLVPWGEYVPLGDLLPFVGQVGRSAGIGSFTPGREVALLRTRNTALGLAICYEIIFPGEVASSARAGGEILVTMTNDAWYGDTSAPWQHYRAARFRAAENRRPVIRAAITGVSGLIDARGRELDRLGVGEVGNLGMWTRGDTRPTLFARAPWAVPILAWLVSAFAIIRGWRKKP